MKFFFKDKKLISNSGYFQDTKHQLNKISKSSAAHSTLILDNTSVCSFNKDSKGNNIIENSIRLINKKIVQLSSKSYLNNKDKLEPSCEIEDLLNDHDGVAVVFDMRAREAY